MDLFRNLFGDGEPPEPAYDIDDALDEANLAAASALVVALERRDAELGLAAHCARVALLAERIAILLDVDEPLRATLRHASLLHEVGMIGVPAELVRRAGILTPEELLQVRRQAELGAEIARATCGPLAATLIRHQYDDYAALREKLQGDPETLALAGILHTADVAEALTRPRAYQSPLPRKTRRKLLQAGAGSRFYPDAVEAYLST